MHHSEPGSAVNIMKAKRESESCCSRTTTLTYLDIHVVLCLKQLAAVDLTEQRLNRNSMAFSLVQHFDGHADRHGDDLQRRSPVYIGTFIYCMKEKLNSTITLSRPKGAI